MKMISKKTKWIIIIFLFFILGNVYIAFQTYSLTHYSDNGDRRLLVSASDLTYTDLFRMAVFGVKLPRPETTILPTRDYESLLIDANDDNVLSAWLIRTDSVSKGMIVYFHGYKGEKSMLLDHAYETLDLGYDALLIDFMGSADSYGNQTTLGYHESANVKSVVDYVQNELGEENIYLLGFSLGGAAIVKAQHEYRMPVKGIMIEAVYGRMIDTIRIRMKKLGFLGYPLSYLVAFWGGVVNNIQPFVMNPEEYAKSIDVPTLVSCGDKDQYIPTEETRRIFDNISSNKKTLKFYEGATHESYLNDHAEDWFQTTKLFLESTK